MGHAVDDARSRLLDRIPLIWLTRIGRDATSARARWGGVFIRGLINSPAGSPEYNAILSLRREQPSAASLQPDNEHILAGGRIPIKPYPRFRENQTDKRGPRDALPLKPYLAIDSFRSIAERGNVASTAAMGPSLFIYYLLRGPEFARVSTPYSPRCMFAA